MKALYEPELSGVGGGVRTNPDSVGRTVRKSGKAWLVPDLTALPKWRKAPARVMLFLGDGDIRIPKKWADSIGIDHEMRVSPATFDGSDHP